MKKCPNPINNHKCLVIVGKYSKSGLCRSCAIIKSNKERIISEETKEKQSKIRKGKTYEEIYGEERAKEIIQSMKKPKSEEHKQNIREARVGFKPSLKTGRKISEANKGKIRIYNEELDDERAVKKEELQSYLDNGYKLGRRPFSDEHIQNGAKARTGLKRSEETKRNQRLAQIKRIENQIGRIYPNYNPKGCQILNEIAKQTNTFIQHAQNGREFHIKELGYFVDGYDKENNIVYEYDEEWHYENGILNGRDIQRQKEIIEHLNCEFIRIKEKDSIESIKKILLERIKI